MWLQHTTWKLYSTQIAQLYLLSVCQLDPPTGGLLPDPTERREGVEAQFPMRPQEGTQLSQD